MPELPEVETTRRGMEPHVAGKVIRSVLVRQGALRWPVSPNLSQALTGNVITGITRRAKYLLFETARGRMMVHLGMSGSLRMASRDGPVRKHDHIDIVFADGSVLRYHDPRRFGSVFWLPPGETHPLIEGLGPEPLSDAFSGDYLFRASRGRRVAVKVFIMNSRVVAGVGNIYASEALYLAGIRPDRAAQRVSGKRYALLAAAIKRVLAGAIESGGTTLRDFVREDGSPGYFKQRLAVYGRGGEPCRRCHRALVESRLGNRSTVYCRGCQR